jgi:hypothetical protein
VQVRLTARGRAVFTEMARAHADWIAELVGALDPAEQDALSTQLSALKAGSSSPAGSRSRSRCRLRSRSRNAAA